MTHRFSFHRRNHQTATITAPNVPAGRATANPIPPFNLYIDQMEVTRPIIVQKFGGTSIGTGERMLHVADIIQAGLRKHRVIVVVSAMSGTVKGEGTTNLLLEAGELALNNKPFNVPLKVIEKNHLTAAKTALTKPRIRSRVEKWLREEMTWLRSFLVAIRVIRELSPRSQDILMATGERFSAYLLAAILEQRGRTSSFVDLIYAVEEKQRTVNPAFFRRVQKTLAGLCPPQADEVPVVTGFFGMVPGGLLRAVGRGYTDFTAALISAGLGRKVVAEMQVWKEVDGVFTADPRRVPAARVLPSISPTEASELTYFGSEVLHPFTMERVVSAQVPIRIKNTFNPEGEGTVIAKGKGKRDKRTRASAVPAKAGATAVPATSNRLYTADGFLSAVFTPSSDPPGFAALFSPPSVSISFTVDRRDEIEAAKPALAKLGKVAIAPGRAILAAVGEGMKYAKGTAGRMFSALGEAGVNIEMISQGASEINISCVIKEEDVETGLRAVHRVFLEGE